MTVPPVHALGVGPVLTWTMALSVCAPHSGKERPARLVSYRLTSRFLDVGKAGLRLKLVVLTFFGLKLTLFS